MGCKMEVSEEAQQCSRSSCSCRATSVTQSPLATALFNLALGRTPPNTSCPWRTPDGRGQRAGEARPHFVAYGYQTLASSHRQEVFGGIYDRAKLKSAVEKRDCVADAAGVLQGALCCCACLDTSMLTTIASLFLDPYFTTSPSTMRRHFRLVEIFGMLYLGITVCNGARLWRTVHRA